MSYAPDYTPGTSFADDETNNVAGRSLVKTDRLDSELADISASINALNANQQSLQRDDGKLADSLVEPYALAEQTRALIAVSGSNPRGTWAPNTNYNYKDVVQRSNIAQMCLQAHNSGSSFTQSYWLPISGDGTSAANAAAAAASASSALASQAAAASSASAAASSASAASTSATNAATSATNASNSASSASTSATNAANRATEAAASATQASNSALAAEISASQASKPGTIFAWPFSTPPSGAIAVPLVSTAISRSAYPVLHALYAAAGYPYGNGDGSTTFNIFYLQADGALLQANGNVGSASNGQIPAHTHGITVYGGAGGGAGLVAVATGSSSPTSSSTGSAGSGTQNLAAGTRVLYCMWAG